MKQLSERPGDLRASEGFWNQKYSLGVPRTEAPVSNLRRVANDYDGKFGVVRIGSHAVENRLAHVVDGAVENESVGVLLRDQFIHGRGKTRGENIEAVIAQRKRQQLGDFRRVVNEQDARQIERYFLPVPEPGMRGFLVAESSRSMTHTRPPAV